MILQSIFYKIARAINSAHASCVVYEMKTNQIVCCIYFGGIDCIDIFIYRTKGYWLVHHWEKITNPTPIDRAPYSNALYQI